MKSRRLGLWAAAMVILLSFGVLFTTAWPVARHQHEIALPVLVLPGSEGTSIPAGSQIPAISERRIIVIEQPARLRVLDEDWVVLSLVIDPEAESATSSSSTGNLFETHHVMAVARLEMPQVGAWREALREPMRPGRPVHFRWAVRAAEASTARGVVWLSLEFVPQAGGEVENLILLSRPITLQSQAFFGQPAWMGRVAGGLGLAAGLISVLWTSAIPMRTPKAEGAAVHPEEG